MDTKINLWHIIISALGLLALLTFREYLLDRNKIEAETARAHCIAEMKQTFPNEANPYSACTDIKTYKLKVEYQK